MNRIFTVLLLLAFITHNSFAQMDVLDSLELSPIEKVMPYISISSVFEKYGSVDIGISKPTGNGNAFGMELGYIYDIDVLNSSIEDSWYQNTYGAKAYFYYRFIIKEKNPYPFNSITFLDIEPQFFWASFENERIAGYSCNEEWGECEYYRFFDSRVERIIPGLNFKLGKIYNYDAFTFILFGGIGIRHIVDFSEMMKDPIPDKLFNRRGQIINAPTGTSLNLRIGFQVAYNIWK